MGVDRAVPAEGALTASGQWGRRDLIVYPLAVVTYVLLGLAWKPLLNWVLGPIWVVVVAGVLPSSLHRLVGRER
jgi:hypothetical protein